MESESDVLKARLKEHYEILDCVSQGLVNELNNEINNSIDELMVESESNPYDKDLQYEIDDLVALRDETLSRSKVCGV